MKGNVFGAGFSASLPPIEVDSLGFRTEPYYYTDFGTYRKGVKGKTTTYTWIQGAANSTVSIDTTAHTLSTPENLDKSNLGSVAGNVDLTIKGNSKVGTLEGEGDSQTLKAGTGNVFGGGEESYVTPSLDNNDQPVPDTGNTTVTIEGNTEVLGNVFGGGNKGHVSGTATVNIGEE